MGLIYGTSNKSVPEISLDASGQLRMNLDPAVNKWGDPLIQQPVFFVVAVDITSGYAASLQLWLPDF